MSNVTKGETDLLDPAHPGEILLLEFLQPMGLSQYALADWFKRQVTPRAA